MKHTHFTAWIKMKGHSAPWGGLINSENCLVLANNGTTPRGRVVEEKKALAARIKAALLAGQPVETSTGIITPEKR